MEQEQTRAAAEEKEPLEAEERDEAKEREQQEAVITAVLFALGGCVEVSDLAKACGCDAKAARKAARSLAEKTEASKGPLLVKEFDGGFQMCTNPAYYENLIRVVTNPKKPVLTDVVMETLAIIAFQHPTTKAEIEKIRGVKSDHAVNRLIEYGLVEETGRLDAPGRPALFAPTKEFYRRFGIETGTGLPKLRPELVEELVEEVREELPEEPGASENPAPEESAALSEDRKTGEEQGR